MILNALIDAKSQQSLFESNSGNIKRGSKPEEQKQTIANLNLKVLQDTSRSYSVVWWLCYMPLWS